MTAVPDAMPDRLAPQLATLVGAPPSGSGWVYEIKFDGYRILARCEGRSTRLYTRNGNDWTAKMESLTREVSLLPVKTAWLDGEVVVLGDDGLPKFNALQNAFDRAGTEHIVYFVFDVLYLNGRDLRGLEFRERRAVLEQLFAGYDQPRVRLSQTFDADGASVLQSACKMGLEGVIAKRLNAPYRSARTDAWLKVKCQLRQEFVIGGFTLRSGTAREIGSLLLGVYDQNGGLRSAGSVGTGWDAPTAEAILWQLEKLEVSISPFAPEYAPTKGRWSKRAKGSERWVKPTTVAEVSFVEWTADGSIRHPTFRGMRKDKPAKSIRREGS
jgi:bifunctional non-homologous end joining protein LigD